jgi:transcriptional regulator with XRE-family HTH domain
LRRKAAGLDLSITRFAAAVEAAERTPALCHLRSQPLTKTRQGNSRNPRKERLEPGEGARRAGIDRSYLGAIERGEFNVSLDTIVKIVKIAAGLDTKPSALCARARL